MLDEETGRVLGVGLVGSGAGELIAEGVLAIEMGATATDMKLSIHPHPTLTETIMESAEVFFGQATHVYKPQESEDENRGSKILSGVSASLRPSSSSVGGRHAWFTQAPARVTAPVGVHRRNADAISALITA